MIPVSRRLQAIVEWIQGTVLADIGCDHGYVAACSVLQNKVFKAYACDIAEGPLQNAKNTIEANDLQNHVVCQLMNGMQGLSDDVDIVVIAGMGAKTIVDILEHGDLENRRFLLMPHKDPDSLRAYLQNHHLIIERERMIFDEGHFYPLMDVIYDIGRKQDLTDVERIYGVNMLQDETYHCFLEKEYSKWSKIHAQMPENKKESSGKILDILQDLRTFSNSI